MTKFSSHYIIKNNIYSSYNSFINKSYNYKNYIHRNSHKRKSATNYNKYNNLKMLRYDETNRREQTSFEDIQNLNDKDEWMEEVNEELNSMTNLKVYEIIKNNHSRM